MSIDMTTLMVVVALWLLFGIAAAVVAQQRGVTGMVGVGFLLGPLGLVLAFTAKPQQAVAFEQTPEHRSRAVWVFVVGAAILLAGAVIIDLTR